MTDKPKTIDKTATPIPVTREYIESLNVPDDIKARAIEMAEADNWNRRQ